MPRSEKRSLATPRDHDHVATAIIQHVMHRQAGDEPHHIAAKVLHSAQKYAGKLFRPDHVFDIVREASKPHHQWRTLQSYGPDALNDVLDHMFHQSGELRQPMEQIGDTSGVAEHVDALLAGDASIEETLSRARMASAGLVRSGSPEWSDRSFGDAERRLEIRRHVQAQGHASKRGTTPLHMMQRGWLRGSLRKLGEE